MWCTLLVPVFAQCLRFAGPPRHHLYSQRQILVTRDYNGLVM